MLRLGSLHRAVRAIGLSDKRVHANGADPRLIGTDALSLRVPEGKFVQEMIAAAGQCLGVATYGPNGYRSICPGRDTAKAFPNVGANASVVAASVVAALTTWRFEPVYVDLQTPHLGFEGARGQTEFDGGA